MEGLQLPSKATAARQVGASGQPDGTSMDAQLDVILLSSSQESADELFLIRGSASVDIVIHARKASQHFNG